MISNEIFDALEAVYLHNIENVNQYGGRKGETQNTLNIGAVEGL